LIRLTIFSAVIFPITPDGIPVRGGVGKIFVPFLFVIGFEMLCGGAKEIPGAKIF
jgi:hypothetical protein